MYSDPGEVVLSLRETIGEMESHDQPWMNVYADGTVERHLPFYMKDAGDWTGKISLVELAALARAVAGAGLVEFDGGAVRAEKLQAERSAGSLTYVSDTSLIEIRVRLAGYQQAGSLVMQRDVDRTVAWNGLRNDERRFPGIPAIQGLGTAFRRLDDLAGRIVATGTPKEEAQ